MRAALACAATLLALLPGAAQAQYTDWNGDYVGFPSNVSRDPVADCADASDACIDRTITEMYRRFHRVVPVCDHNAVFSLTYTRVTEDIRRGLHGNFYPDRAWLNQLDAIFARSYFLAYDNWSAARRELVPPAWLITFDSARERRVAGMGNLLMSMNAHVNRDFPFMLYHAGLARPDGTSRKSEHDSGNQRLRAMYKPMLAELAQRFDATIDDHDVQGTEADDEGFFSVLVSWRESAWQNAVRLARAADDAERRDVARSIERDAEAQARVIEANAAYRPGQTSAVRDALCARAGGQDPAWSSAAGALPPAPGAARALRPARGVRLTRRGEVPVTLTCPARGGACSGSVRVERRRRVVGRRAFALRRGARRTIRIALPRPARRALARAGRVRLVVVVASRTASGETVERRTRITLRA